MASPATNKSAQRPAHTLGKPYLTWLLAVFAAWKLLLLLVAYLSPGPGYDTSTRIWFDQYDLQPRSSLNRFVEHVTMRLTRWDAIYFSASSERGHLYEQEWAFSWAMSKITAELSKVIPSLLHSSLIVKHALAGVLMSHISHLGAILTLYTLVDRLIRTNRGSQIAFTAACLHTVSPAGVFLSAPYGESTFAFMTFLGILCYIRALEYQHLPYNMSPHRSAAWSTLSGLCFATSTLFRSNGLLQGLMFAIDAIRSAQALFATRKLDHAIHLLGTLVGGALIAIGFALPQTVAYFEYCMSDLPRPWCSRFPPSIYTWVQQHYWHVGFLSYWTPGNVPLFLLAAPMLAVMMGTGLTALLHPQEVLYQVESTNIKPSSAQHRGSNVFLQILTRLAVPQLVLAILALTSFHVQIINRISSGCALWYIVLAIAVVGQNDGVPETNGITGMLRGRRKEIVVKAMAMYAIVQGGLYAAFLPPA